MMIALPPAATTVPMCAPRQLSLSVDGRDGDFNGMSHSGTLLVVRNRGRTTCRVPGLPEVTFRDAHGRPLPIKRQAPRFMHPGPVIVPVAIPARGSASTALRWVSGPVYDQSRCYDAASVGVTIGGKPLLTRLAAHICGPGTGATFEQPVLTAGSGR